MVEHRQVFCPADQSGPQRKPEVLPVADVDVLQRARRRDGRPGRHGQAGRAEQPGEQGQVF